MSTASSPGKLILSGEHAILAGCPALAMACTPRVVCRATPNEQAETVLCLPQRSACRRTPSETADVHDRIVERHAQGRPPSSPEDLLFAALHRTAPGWTGTITFETDLPIGSGMGASAAFLLSLLRALRPDTGRDSLYSTALELEHLQHGVSSGLDLWTSLNGGVWWVECPHRTSLPLDSVPDFQLLHTGAPSSTTGECVNRVREQFPEHHAIWKEFRVVVERTRKALLQHRADDWSDAMRENHALLCRIGVVPDSVQDQIRQVEANGGAAKICGAGSIRGTAAGVVLVRDLPPENLPATWRRIPAEFTSTGAAV